jgi:hypothetical protein
VAQRPAAVAALRPGGAGVSRTGLEAVAQARLSDQPARPGRVGLQLAAQLRLARFQGFRKSVISQLRGYELRVRGNGGWQVVANGPAAVTLASGRVAAARSYTLNLATRGSIISARIDGVLVASVTNRIYRYGPAGLGSLGYYPVRYPGFTIRPQ